jgi:hypothetical protein
VLHAGRTVRSEGVVFNSILLRIQRGPRGGTRERDGIDVRAGGVLAIELSVKQAMKW